MQEKLRIIIGGNVDRERYRQLILSAEEKLDQLAIPYGDIVLWEINTRAKKRFGQCRAMRKGCFSINIAAMLFQAEDRYVEEVILHELLHPSQECKSSWETVEGVCGRNQFGVWHKDQQDKHEGAVWACKAMLRILLE